MPLISLRKQNARGIYPNNLDWQNLRQQKYGYIAAANRSNLLDARTTQIVENAWGAPAIQIPVMNKNKPSVTSGPMTCSFTANEADAEFVSVTYVQGHVPIEIVPSQHNWNEISRDQDFVRQLKDAEEAIADDIESKIQAAIDTAKSTTYNSGFVGVGKRYPLLAAALQASGTDKDFFYNDLKSIMFSDNFDMNDLEVIGDAAMISFVQKFINQGAGNDENQAFQFMGYNFGFSNSTPTSAAAISTAYCFPKNSLTILSQIRPECKVNAKSTKGKHWSTMKSELLGFDLSVLFESDCDDVNVRTGFALDTASLKENWTLEYNIAILTPFDNSTNGGIKKFDFLT